MSQKIPVHAAIACALRDQGVATLYGLVGDANLFMVDHFARELKGRYVAAVHECGAVLMALGYASVTGDVGVATITHGPAVSNRSQRLSRGPREQYPSCCYVAIPR